MFWKHRGVYHIKRAFKGKLRFVINGKVFVFCWKIIYQTQLMSPKRFFRDFIVVRPAITSLPIKREIREKKWNYLRLFSNQMFAIAPSFHWREHNSLERNRVSFFFSIICLGFLYPLESNHEVKSLNYIFDARPRRRKEKSFNLLKLEAVKNENQQNKTNSLSSFEYLCGSLFAEPWIEF